MDPAEAVGVERQAPEPRRQDPHRVAAGADVVREAGKRQLRGPDAAADLVPRLDHQDGRAGLRERDRGG